MKKWFFLGITVLSLVSLSACSTSGNKDEAKVDKSELKPYGKYKKPIEFNVGRSQWDMAYMTKGDTIKDNPATRFMIQETNIHPKVLWESADYNQKLALAISTGDLPDVFSVNEEQYHELLENDMIADLTDVYEKAASKNVKKRIHTFGKEFMNKVKDDKGRIRAIPAPYFYYEQNVTWIRKDWLEKVGAKTPETVQELHDVAKKFVDAKLGGETTTGIALNEKVMGEYGTDFEADTIVNQLGAYPRQWVNKDGKAVYGSTTPETKKALALLRDWYKEGLIDKQFAVRSDEERKGLLAGSVGIQFAPWYSVQFTMGESYKNDKNAEWIALAGPKGENGKFETYRSEPIASYTVVRKGYEHPEAIMRGINNVIDFNFSLTDKAIKFREKEIGKSYFPWYYAPIQINIVDSQRNKQDYEAIKKAVETKSTEQLPSHLTSSYGLIKNYLNGSKEIKDWSEYHCYFEGDKAGTDQKTVYNEMAFYGKTDTMRQRWANLEKLEDETFIKIIMGNEDISKFDQFVKEWNKQGGEQITKEVNEQIAQDAKK